MVLGVEAAVLAALGRSTSYVERTHLTMRSSSVRRGLKFSKDVLLHQAAAAWDDRVHNVARPLKTRRQRLTGDGQRRWRQRTPATGRPD